MNIEKCNRCGKELGRPVTISYEDIKIKLCNTCGDLWNNREHRAGGIKQKPWMSIDKLRIIKK